MRIFCFSPFGYEGNLVTVEVDLRRGIPAVDIVGLADNAVKESRERMKSAIVNSGFSFPPERVLISLSPADVKKEGAGFDLAIALAVLSAKEQSENGADNFHTEPILVMGELELNGSIRPVKAIHAAAATAYAGGIRYSIVPAANADEAREIQTMKIFGAENLTEALHALNHLEYFSDSKSLSSCNEKNGVPAGSVEINGILFPPEEFDFSQVRGQKKLLRGLQIAAAGGHNLLAFGPPGCGKTLSLQHFPSLVPLLTKEESQSTTRIYSIAGILQAGTNGIRKAPFRQPHQTSSIEGMCGGGVHCSPGEISLAHNGALFLDEAAEFKTSVLQILRVPLETGTIMLSRAGRTTIFPSNFQLLVSMNPCPCGNYGSKEKMCLCSSRSVELYWRKLSAPLLDRIDLSIQVEKSAAIKSEFEEQTSTSELRKEIAAAVKIQRKRGKKNSRLNPAELKEFCQLEPGAKKILNEATGTEEFSARAVSSCIKIARTIADMKEENQIGKESMEEAVQLKKATGALGLLR
ncbi:YifB family Mg chelatase-like AAA ATPase [Treponema sp.]|uniref:YifB family Mg chelatase-like AAA ATPase n=1 Tax=Treponema sp. TaxID=166 RepID=UPI003EFD7C84